MEWNILATAFTRKERALLKLMRNFGEFKGSGYRDVLLGRSKFYVRIKRRGHKGEISSQESEKETTAFILGVMGKAGKRAEVKFEDPDKFIIVETIENRAGVGLITREMRERYSFIRAK